MTAPTPLPSHRPELRQHRRKATLGGLPSFRFQVACSCGWESDAVATSGVAWDAFEFHREQEGIL